MRLPSAECANLAQQPEEAERSVASHFSMCFKAGFRLLCLCVCVMVPAFLLL